MFFQALARSFFLTAGEDCLMSQFLRQRWRGGSLKLAPRDDRRVWVPKNVATGLFLQVGESRRWVPLDERGRCLSHARCALDEGTSP